MLYYVIFILLVSLFGFKDIIFNFLSVRMERVEVYFVGCYKKLMNLPKTIFRSINSCLFFSVGVA